MSPEQSLEGILADVASKSIPLSFDILVDFDAVVRAHQPRIYRLMLGMLRDPDAAENLTQECFLKAYQNRHSYRGEASLSTWLIRIAINLIQDHRRSRRWSFWHRLFEAGQNVEAMAEGVSDGSPSPERRILAREKLLAVWSAVEHLSEQQRLVFTLRFVEEMSLDEIAAATSLTTGTVKSHLFRAVNKVRRQLKNW